MKIAFYLLRITMAVAFVSTIFLLTKKPSFDKIFLREEISRKEEDLNEISEQFFLQRSFPDTVFAIKAYDQAIQQALKDSRHSRSLTGFDLPWLLEGPGNIGGRFNVLTIDPNNNNIMYAGCASGGVFKTSDGGANWTPVFDDQPYLSISCITLDPLNSNIIYVGTGDLNISGFPFIGDGVYKSINGGATWTHLGLSDQRIISEIKINPNNTQIIYAATMGLPMVRNSDRGLYKSVDGGANWSQVLYVNDSTGVIALQMDYNNPNTLYAATWNRIRNNHEGIIWGVDAHIYKTTDGGVNWNILSNGLPSGVFSRISMTMSGTNSQILYCTFVDTTLDLYGIYKTSNGGNNWTQLAANGLNNPLNGQGWYSGGIFVNPTNNNELWLCGVDLWRSDDGGANWALGAPEWWNYIVHGDHHCVSFSNTSVFASTDGGIYSKPFASSNWSDIENIPDNQFYRVVTHPFQSGLYVGGVQDNGTTGGNATVLNNWDRYYGGDGFQARYNSVDPDFFYFETQNGGITETTDGGNNFNNVGALTDPNDRRNWDMPYFLSPQDQYTMYLATDKIYSYSAGSGFVSPISNDLTDGNIFGERFHNISTIDQSAIDGNNMYAGTSDGNVWRSLNQGVGWNNITGNLPERYVTSIHASPNSAASVYVTHSGYKENEFIPHVHRSDNNGTTWVDVSGDLPQLAVNDIYILPDHNDSVLFVATDGGVYATISSGNHWERLGIGMPVCAVYEVEYDTLNHKLLAGTFARSLMSYNVDSMLYVAPKDTTIDTTYIHEVTAMIYNVYPNPASSYIKVILKNTNDQSVVSILNSEGKILNTVPVKNYESEIDVSEYAEGVYYITIKRNEKSFFKKIIVVH